MAKSIMDTLNTVRTQTDTDALAKQSLGVGDILTSQYNQVIRKQGTAMAADQRTVEAANLVVNNDAQLANILLDKKLADDSQLANQWKELDNLADPVTQARTVSSQVQNLQQAVDVYNQDSEDANSLNPFVGIPGSLRKHFSESAMQGAARTLQTQVQGFDQIQHIREAALSNYQTRAQLVTRKQVEATKTNNELKAAHQVLANNESLSVKDLQFTMGRYALTEKQQENMTKVLNAKYQGKQIQLATVQAEIEAKMMPFRLENLQLQTEVLRDDVTARRTTQGAFHKQYPDMLLPPEWWKPSVQASMDGRMVAALHDTMVQSNFTKAGTVDFAAAQTAARTGTDPQAAQFLAGAEELVTEQVAAERNAFAKRARETGGTTKGFVPSLDPRNADYQAKVSTLVTARISEAEQVDSEPMFANQRVVLESLRAQIKSGELDTQAAVNSKLIDETTRTFLRDTDFDLIISGAGASKQASDGIEQMVTARDNYKTSKGVKVSNEALARVFKYWSQNSLERSNSSPNTSFSFKTLTLPNVNSFTDRTGVLGGFVTEKTPFNLTSDVQILARIDAASRKRTKVMARGRARSIMSTTNMYDTGGMYPWMKTK